MLEVIAGLAIAILLLSVAWNWWSGLLISLFKAACPNLVWEFETCSPAVALTFDDGPDPDFTPRVLDLLSTYNIQATFFLVGERARSYPHIVEAIRQKGHDIGNHSDSWRRTLTLSGNAFKEDLLRAEKSLALSNHSQKFFRPAGGWIRPGQIRVAKNLGYTCVLGSSYGFDPHRPPVRFIVWAITRSLRAGTIIVLHDSGGDRSLTLDSIPLIILAARDKGLEFKTLSELMARASG